MRIKPVTATTTTTPADHWKPLIDMLTAWPDQQLRVSDLPEGGIFRVSDLREILEKRMPGYKIVVEYGDTARTPQSYLITAHR